MTTNTWMTGTTLQAGDEGPTEEGQIPPPPDAPTGELASPRYSKPKGGPHNDQLACSCCKPSKLFENEKSFM
jgi:hypothetical protein